MFGCGWGTFRYCISIREIDNGYSPAAICTAGLIDTENSKTERCRESYINEDGSIELVSCKSSTSLECSPVCEVDQTDAGREY